MWDIGAWVWCVQVRAIPSTESEGGRGATCERVGGHDMLIGTCFKAEERERCSTNATRCI